MIFEKLMGFLLRFPYELLQYVKTPDGTQIFSIVNAHSEYLSYIDKFFNTVGYFLPMPLIAAVLAFMTEMRLGKISVAFMRRCKSFVPFMSGD